jgi:hypothetical protein
MHVTVQETREERVTRANRVDHRAGCDGRDALHLLTIPQAQQSAVFTHANDDDFSRIAVPDAAHPLLRR